jgi:BirA family transcriptional regulator, biotin operon repressor / biotin---[acetyl-CoA-carboxylase] ligase
MGAASKVTKGFFSLCKTNLLSFYSSIGTPFIELQQVESTNNYATGLVHAEMAQSGTAVFAHYQSKGKGQRAKSWQGESGKNIALSVVLKGFPFSLSQSFLLSMATAVGVHNFFFAHAGSETKIKWPNDLYWRDRKAGGILIENIIQGNQWKAAVAGVGININQTQFGELGTKAVSLKQITGNSYEPVRLAKELCAHLANEFEMLAKQPSGIVEDYQKNLYKRGETVRLKQGSRVFDAVVKGVSNTGKLIVEHATEEQFAVGEVEWVM